MTVLKSKLSPGNGFAVLRQLNPIHKKEAVKCKVLRFCHLVIIMLIFGRFKYFTCLIIVQDKVEEFRI